MGLSTLIQIPCHHVLTNEIDLNLKYRIGLKQFFNIILGIGIIEKTNFLFVFFDISPDQNLSKHTGRYVENPNKKVVFSFLPPKLINIILLF